VAHAWAWVEELDELQCEMKVRRGVNGRREGGREGVRAPFLLCRHTDAHMNASLTPLFPPFLPFSCSYPGGPSFFGFL